MSVSFPKTFASDDECPVVREAPQSTTKRPVPQTTQPDPVVIVGNGPVGMRLMADLFERNRKLPVVIFGEEEHQPYDRVKLPSWLAGEMDLQEISKPYRRPFGASLSERYGVKVVSINRKECTVTDNTA